MIKEKYVIIRRSKKMNKKVRRSSRPIVVGHLEKISSLIFDRYQEQITELTKGGQGVYALYRRNKLYYIGLASDLKQRVRWHLRDRHKGKWDRFSLYMIRRTDHIREVESLVVRIAEPAGNTQRGKLRRSRNLLPELQRQVKKQQEKEREKLFGRRKIKLKAKKIKKRRKRPIGRKIERPLKGKFKRGKVIYAKYKDKEYKAWVYGSGGIRFQGKIYETPSGAAKAVLDRGAADGWYFWKYKNISGELVYLSELRK